MKESKHKADKGLIFRETFNSEADVRRNGGVPTDTTFEDGLAKYPGVSSGAITYANRPLLAGYYTIRFRFKYFTESTYRYLFTRRFADGSSSTDPCIRIYNVPDTLEVNGVSNDNIYVNGVDTNTITTGSDKEIVAVFRLLDDINSFYLFGYTAGGGNGLFGSEAEFVEIYNYRWSAEEVANAYNKSRFRDIAPDIKDRTILDVNAFGGSVVNRLTGDVYGDYMDSGKGDFDTDETGDWTPYGNNTVEIVTDTDALNGYALKITYVDNSNGAYSYFRETRSLNQDLVVGKVYELVHRIKVNTGSTLNVLSPDGIEKVIRNTEYKTYTFRFTCTSATNNTFVIGGGGMGTGEIAYLDYWYVKEVIPEPTIINVDVVKDGDVRVMQFGNGNGGVNPGFYDDFSGSNTTLFWIKIDKYTLGDELYFFSNDEFEMRVLSGLSHFYAYGGGGNYVQSVTTLYDMIGVWTLVTFVKNSVNTDNCKLYVNGSLERTSLTVSSTSTNALRIGANYSGTYPTTGKISAFRIIDGLLTAEEISQIYTSEKHLYNK